MRTTRSLIAFIGFLAGALVSAGLPVTAGAGMIGTQQMVATQQRADDLATVQNFLSRDAVRAQMENLGVDPADAAARVASLTDSELASLATHINQQPAGGDGVLVILGIVFLVLIVLELVGVTHIFVHR